MVQLSILRLERAPLETHARGSAGWVSGEESFRPELLAQIDGRMGKHHYGAERQESAEENAERMVRKGLKKAGWTEEALRLRRKSDAVKIKLAADVRQETTRTLRWIAERLPMERLDAFEQTPLRIPQERREP